MSPISNSRAVLRRILVSVALSGAALAGVGSTALAAPSPAAISGDAHSPAVIEQANVALEAHDVFSYAGTPDAFVAYLGARNATADVVAFELGLDPVALRDAWARADLPHQKAVLAALTQIGAPYVKNTSDPNVGFDCSGLTAYAWGRAGVELSRQSSAQINAARSIDQSEAFAGDLAQYPGHVMMYLGVGDAIVHAANHEKDIAIGFLSRDVRFGDPTG
jgi:cell wall-associated NlpC family hydrolase